MKRKAPPQTMQISVRQLRRELRGVNPDALILISLDMDHMADTTRVNPDDFDAKRVFSGEYYGVQVNACNPRSMGSRSTDEDWRTATEISLMFEAEPNFDRYDRTPPPKATRQKPQGRPCPFCGAAPDRFGRGIGRDGKTVIEQVMHPQTTCPLSRLVFALDEWNVRK